MDFREKLISAKDRVKLPDVSRRQLLVGGAAAGGLLLAWTLWPRDYATTLVPGANEADFGGWLTIGRDGVVTVAIPQLEMGQGITTLLAQVAAVELGADWRQVGAEPVMPSGLFPNLPLAADWAPLWANFPSLADTPDAWLVDRFASAQAFNATVAGTSLAAYEMPLRIAAASARDMLVRAAAERWDVVPEECEVADGFVRHSTGGALRFGELVDEARELDPPDPAPLRPQAAFEQPVFGEADAQTSFPRIDLPSKVDGSHLFAGDIRLPGMVFASIRHGPVGLPELFRFDADAAAGMRGLVGVVKSKRWLAAVAESWWIADQALSRMRAHFTGPGALEQAVLDTDLERASEQREELAERIVEVGDPDTMLVNAAFVRRYEIAPAVHAPLETASATARFVDGRLELWMASQVPSLAREGAAKAIGISAEDVVLYPVAAGGSFDARLEKQHAIEIAQIAVEIGRPVQLTWSRVQDLQAVPPRAPATADMAARTGADGQPLAWRARITTPPFMREMGHRLFDNLVPEAARAESRGEADALAVAGGMPPYGISDVAVDHVPASIRLPVTRMRGGAEAMTAFFTECFIDELAAEAGRDPFLYRMALLGGAPRMAECLRRATRLGEWDGARSGSGQGVAMVRMGNDPQTAGHIACVAQAGMGAGGARVTKLSATVDIGRIVNLDIARQQIEGGLVFGLSLALGSSVRFENGHPVPRNMGALGLPRLADCPDIVVDFISSDAEPFDPGELGVAVAAPAIANALFAATGLRMRRLPLLSEGL
ncbi:molybdopterin-dependent oxidoreductase [Qipengyuania sp. GH38]|uniref:xanthine dehydrogenase family protein molybdopterin-binding subunit n=1 Tax=Qipengyuania intermedia TaxID=2867244 RepID=UPI001C86FED5|nr:molybdopterin cofactor-binding domain-containing protein [Qipengyuania intermedia]MBX7514353.1 molybdopterin-dependent oxidoreductase [Qipengyuania intermedia]